MTKTIRIILLIIWVVISPLTVLGIGFAGLEAFNPVRLWDDILSADIEGVLTRLAVYFVVVFPIYLVVYFIRNSK